MKKMSVFKLILFILFVICGPAIAEGDSAEPHPIIRYQGCPVVDLGEPLTGIFHLEVSVFDSVKGGLKIWGPEEHPSVDIDNGCIDIVLGGLIPFPEGEYNDPLYLKFSVDGIPIENRVQVDMKETSVPSDVEITRSDGEPIITHELTAKASGVYGAHIANDITDAGGLYVVGDGIGLYVEELGDGDVGIYSPDFIDAQGYRSNSGSYLWFPGTLAVPAGWAATAVEVSYEYNGSVVVKKISSSGETDLYIPLALPGVLFGQKVTVSAVSIYYKCSSASSFINTTWLYKQNGASSPPDVIVESFTTHKSTSDASYPVYPYPAELDESRGMLNLVLRMNFANTTDTITVGGVRLYLSHR